VGGLQLKKRGDEMKVKELIAKLKLVDEELEVVHSMDGEGNCYSDIKPDCLELFRNQVIIYPGTSIELKDGE